MLKKITDLFITYSLNALYEFSKILIDFTINLLINENKTHRITDSK